MTYHKLRVLHGIDLLVNLNAYHPPWVSAILYGGQYLLQLVQGRKAA